jgi:hypothetical protein
MHAVYHASDWYWENEDLGRGPGWKKVVGDVLGIVAGAALTIGSGGADMGIGVAVAAAATGSLFGDDSGGLSGGGLTDPLICIDDNWRGCAILNIALTAAENRVVDDDQSPTFNRVSVPDDWSLKTDKPENNSSNEKSAFGLVQMGDGLWYPYFFASPTTCHDIDNAAQSYNSNTGGDVQYSCYELSSGGGGASGVIVMLQDEKGGGLVFGLDYTTPQGDVSYNLGELNDLGYISESILVRDFDEATEVLRSGDSDVAEYCDTKGLSNNSSDEKICWVSGSLNGVSFRLMFVNNQCSDMGSWMETQENNYGDNLAWSDPACQDYSDVIGGAAPYCVVSGYHLITAEDSETPTDKSGEEDKTERSGLPGFTGILCIMAFLGAAVISRSRN